MQLIDGKLVAKTIREDLKQKIAEAYDKYGKKFTLTVIIAGEDPASQISFNFRYRAISTRRTCLNLFRPKKTLTVSARAI